MVVFLLGPSKTLIWSESSFIPFISLYARVATFTTVLAKGVYLHNKKAPLSDVPHKRIIFYIHGGGFCLITETERVIAGTANTTSQHCLVSSALSSRLTQPIPCSVCLQSEG